MKPEHPSELSGALDTAETVLDEATAPRLPTGRRGVHLANRVLALLAFSRRFSSLRSIAFTL
jgi:hypothetical protein